MAYTAINDPQKHFNTAIYTGNYESGGSIHKTQPIVGVGFQPDFIWIKNRDTTNDHEAYDSSRGITKLWVVNSGSVEATVSTRITSFDSDGVTVKSDPSVNQADKAHVAWLWKANGGTTAANTDGSVDTTVQVNTTAGFSMVQFASGASGQRTYGHGLGVAPTFIILVDLTQAESRVVYHSGMAASDQWDKYMLLENTNAVATSADGWGTAVPSSTVFGLNVATLIEASQTFIAYCFAPIQGYSKFGSYVGNGNADGPFVYTGFKPALLIYKRSSAAGNDWVMVDNKRDPGNPTDRELYANGTYAEGDVDLLDFLSNGFKLRRTHASQNDDGSTYVYAAFAESPFVTSNGSPTNSR